MYRLSKSEIESLLNDLFTDFQIESKTINRYWATGPSKKSLLYVSQCKPSQSSKGNWTYEFFHTIKFDNVLEILETYGSILLVDYVRKRYCLLSPADIGWIIRFSSRNKSNEGQVIDVVIKEKYEGQYFLRSYDTHKKIERKVLITSFK